MNNALHMNDNYSVMVNSEGDGYEVVNNNTNIVEFKSINLPECIFSAENLNVVLVHKTYEWVGKRAAEQMALDAKAEAAEAGLHSVN